MQGITSPGMHCAYPRRDDQVELTETNDPHWELNSDTVTHPSTNRTRRSLTLLMETNVLPLHETTGSVPVPCFRSSSLILSITKRQPFDSFYAECFLFLVILCCLITECILI